MAMTREQGLKTLKYASNMFDMEIDKETGMAWLEVLMERGDYEKTHRNIKNRASEGSPYKPKLSEIMVKSSNTNNEVVKEVDVTKTHAYKKKHDKEYAKTIEEFKKLRDRIAREAGYDE